MVVGGFPVLDGVGKALGSIEIEVCQCLAGLEDIEQGIVGIQLKRIVDNLGSPVDVAGIIVVVGKIYSNS